MEISQLEFAQRILTMLPIIMGLAGLVTWIVEQLKPYLITPLNLSERAYPVVLRLFSALVGVVIAGFFGSMNLFAGMQFYGYIIPDLLGAVMTGIAISAGAAVWHELGERLNAPPGDIVLVADDPIPPDDGSADSSKVSASSVYQPPYQRN